MLSHRLAETPASLVCFQQPFLAKSLAQDFSAATCRRLGELRFSYGRLQHATKQYISPEWSTHNLLFLQATRKL